MNSNPNIVRIKAILEALENLQDQVVFVGGATAALYATRPQGEIRPTDDVDIVVELSGYSSYAELEEKLRDKGFVNDVDSGVICRYRGQGIIVDIMPTESSVLGFSNKWYKAGFTSSIKIDIGDGYRVRIFTAVYFIASKLVAFFDRGEGDGRTSTDFEDIVTVFNGRPSIYKEMQEADPTVKGFLRESFLVLRQHSCIYEWISVHLDYSEQSRVEYIIGGLSDFVSTFDNEKT